MNSETPGSTIGLRQPQHKSGDDTPSAELEKARAELRRVNDRAEKARQETEQLRVSVAKTRRDTKLVLRVAAALMLTAALIKITWLAMEAPQTVPKIITPLPPATAALVPPHPTPAREMSDSAADLQLSRALNRLLDAFHTFPEEDQKDLVREINEKDTGGALACPLAWNDAGVPSLYLGDRKGEVPPSMITALNQCASEVEKLRIERGPAKPL